MDDTSTTMGLVNCSKVYVDKSHHGLSVFAKKDLGKGELVETGVMMRMKNVDGNENEHLFYWGSDRNTWASGSGCLPFYNHSEYPNVRKVGDLDNDRMYVIALRDIYKGEELRNTYISSRWRECFKNLE